jgi:hypothetical protein
MCTTSDAEMLLSRFRLTPDNRIFDGEQDITEKVCEELRDSKQLPDCTDKVSVLQVWLYRNYYTRPGQPETTDADIEKIDFETDSGISQLYWQSDYWRYADGSKPPSTSHNNFVLTRGSEAQWAETGKFLEVGYSEAEQWILLRISRSAYSFDKSQQNDRYNWVYSSRSPTKDWQGGIRFYFNLKPTRLAASVLIRQIRSSFDLYDIPFSLKFPVSVEQYNRADSAVLYTEERYLFIVAHLLRDAYAALIDSDSLRTETIPLFTALVAPGLGLAEDPFSTASFGMNRCGLLAMAIDSVREVADPDERLEQAVAYIENKQYTLDRFFRNPGSIIEYSYLMDLFKQPSELYRTIRFSRSDENEWFELPGYNRKRFLAAAVRIALDICRETHWYSSGEEWHCNWLSYFPGGKKDAVTYRLLDNSFHEGIDGIKYFLNKVYGLYDSPVIKEVIDHCGSSVPVHQSLIPHDVAWKNGLLKVIFLTEEDRKETTSKLLKGFKLFGDWRIEPGFIPGNRKNFINPPQGDAISLALQGGPLDEKLATQLIREKLADELIRQYLDTGRPLGNGYKSGKPELNDLFCPNLKYGLAWIGYFFLRVYDPRRFGPIHLA